MVRNKSEGHICDIKWRRVPWFFRKPKELFGEGPHFQHQQRGAQKFKCGSTRREGGEENPSKRPVQEEQEPSNQQEMNALN